MTTRAAPRSRTWLPATPTTRPIPRRSHQRRSFQRHKPESPRNTIRVSGHSRRMRSTSSLRVARTRLPNLADGSVVKLEYGPFGKLKYGPEVKLKSGADTPGIGTRYASYPVPTQVEYGPYLT